MKKCAYIFFALLCSINLSIAGKKYEFNGRTVTDPKTGLSIVGDKTHGIIAVTNRNANYAIILPYSEPWSFSLKERGYLLYGVSGNIIVSLWVVNETISPKSLLERLNSEHKKPNSVPGIISTEFVEYNKDTILINKIDGNLVSEIFNEMIQVNYFNAKVHIKDIYVLHISRVINKSDSLSTGDDAFLKYMTAGFSTNFKMEKD